MENATTSQVKTKWVLDPSHSEITFKVKHLMISNVKGAFNHFEATIDGEDFTKSQIKGIIDVSSINTNNSDRDNHLRSADFFDADNYKELLFTSTSFKKIKGESYKLLGDLTIRGISKPVALEVELGGIVKDPYGNVKAGFSVSGKINRKEWGLNWNAALETGGVLVSDEVYVSAELQFTKQ